MVYTGCSHSLTYDPNMHIATIKTYRRGGQRLKERTEATDVSTSTGYFIQWHTARRIGR